MIKMRMMNDSQRHMQHTHARTRTHAHTTHTRPRTRTRIISRPGARTISRYFAHICSYLTRTISCLFGHKLFINSHI